VPEAEALRDILLEPHAVKELIEPNDVADTVAFLLGRAGRSFSGVPLTMDLGWTAR
jgi:3-hydroxybutyrate dehydrogenase